MRCLFFFIKMMGAETNELGGAFHHRFFRSLYLFSVNL